MPDSVILSCDYTGDATVIPNIFIDDYLPRANGEFLKIYLYLLRRLPERDARLSLGQMADTFFMTENDILRALRYWEKEGLLALAFDGQWSSSADGADRWSGHTLTGIRLNPIKPRNNRQQPASGAAADSFAMTHAASSGPSRSTPAGAADDSMARPMSGGTAGDACATRPTPMGAADDSPMARPTSASGARTANAAARTVPAGQAQAGPAHNSRDTVYSMKELEDFSRGDGEQLLFIIQQYLGHPLSQTDLNTIYYFYDDLEFSIDLIEYLFEYCVSGGHTHMRYIEKVALSWARQHVTTVDEARSCGETHQRSCYAVLKAFGLGSRQPAPGEAEYVNKWIRTYGFSLELILEACRRTMMAVHTPSFEYTDKILDNWRSGNAFTMREVLALDQARAAGQKAAPQNRRHQNPAAAPRASRPSSNKFHNFRQRSYDYEALEKKLSQKLQNTSGEGAPTPSGDYQSHSVSGK